jgi:HPt (histidine-containing phosphotransfer) domain-containing protein
MKSFDYDRAMEAAGGDAELFCELMSIFNSQIKQNLQGLEIALAAGDYEHVAFVANTLKGALGNLGALQGAQIAGSLEVEGQQQNLATVKKLMQELWQEIDKFKTEVAHVQS